MANITKQKRDKMLNFIKKLKEQNKDDESIVALNEIENALTDKKFGLVFEEHTEEADEKLKEDQLVLEQKQRNEALQEKKEKLLSDMSDDEFDDLLEQLMLERRERKRKQKDFEM